MPRLIHDRNDSRCFLCGKSREHVKKLILGVHGGVCLDCVGLCNEIIRSDRSGVEEIEPAGTAARHVLQANVHAISLSSVDRLVQAALDEDIGSGDITSSTIVHAATLASATIKAKSKGIVCGLDAASAAFRLVDPGLSFVPQLGDGHEVAGKGESIAVVAGSARSILTAERVALNFLQRLSGIATITKQFVTAVSATSATIVDTRKTTPILRVLEKYAVRVGGGKNHRFGLFDGVLIKDNHIAAAGGIEAAVRAARLRVPHTLRIEVEAAKITQVQEALAAGADIIMLDNMSISQMTEAVNLIDGRAITEASGGVSLQSVREIAQTGVDLISVGMLTHSAPSVDISLDLTL